MTTFAVKHVPGLEEIVPFRKRHIAKLHVDGECAYDTFRAQMETNGGHDAELDKIDTFLIQISQGKELPVTQFKLLKRNKGDLVKDHEIRTKNLRVYLFETEKGLLIISGGSARKPEQDLDIDNMRRVKAKFYDHLKTLKPD